MIVFSDLIRELWRVLQNDVITLQDSTFIINDLWAFPAPENQGILNWLPNPPPSPSPEEVEFVIRKYTAENERIATLVHRLVKLDGPIQWEAWFGEEQQKGVDFEGHFKIVNEYEKNKALQERWSRPRLLALWLGEEVTDSERSELTFRWFWPSMRPEPPKPMYLGKMIKVGDTWKVLKDTST
jgi:hypothetical protein